MDLGLKVILLGGLLLNLALGFSLSWFIVERLAVVRKPGSHVTEDKVRRAFLFLVLGTVASAATFVLSVVLIWPPHVW